MPSQTELSAILPVDCQNEDCHLRSVYRFFGDGSHEVILRACWHEKNFPTRATILETIVRENSGPATRQAITPEQHNRFPRGRW